MTYKAPTPGRFDKRLNTTNYDHPQETNLLNVHKAMEYNPYGQPVLRITNPIQDAAQTSKNRTRVSEFITTFFSTFQFGKALDLWDEQLTNGATAVWDEFQNSIRVSVTSTPGSQAIRQTRQVMNYIPGRPAEFSAAWVFPAVPGVRVRYGVFDEKNGMFFERDADGEYYCVVRSNVTGTPVDTRIARPNWNIDPMDGTNPSGIIGVPGTIQLLLIEYEWYGAGIVKFSFVMNGVKYPIHQFNHANILSDVYMSTPFNPIRLELTNVSSNVGSSIIQASTSFGLEGSSTQTGQPMVQNVPLAGINTGNTANTFVPFIALRLKDTYKHAVAILDQLQALTTDNTVGVFRLILNPTTLNGTWTDHERVGSVVQYNNTATSYTGGEVLYRGIMPASGEPFKLDGSAFQIGRTNLGTVSDVLLVAVATTNANKIVIGTLYWNEQR